MKVDCYRSKTRPSFGIVLPSGAKIDNLTGNAGDAAARLFPFELVKSSVELDTFAQGDLFEHLSSQISENGAGLIKTRVTFNEVMSD